jgi:twitching motility protein PilT
MSYFDVVPILEQMLAVSQGISDLNFSVGRPPQVEVNGALMPVEIKGLRALTPYQTEIIAMTLLAGSPDAVETLVKTGAADLACSLPGRNRFRVNIFSQRGTYCIVMRLIPHRVPTLADLRLPSQLAEIAELKNGFVLVTGPTGSGKSSTLAAIIDQINGTKPYHVVTIEDPIEYAHQHRRATINQRELGGDTPSFARALRAALRQAPKVILVGEIRHVETAEIAMEAAETGHLVLSTLHTIDASHTVERFIGIFPKAQEETIRSRLAQSFRYIISQRLLPRADGKGRIAAVEILRSTLRTRQYIEKGQDEGKSLVDAMNDGELEGMQSFDRTLEKMARAGQISVQDALAYASNPGNLRLQIVDLLQAEGDAEAEAATWKEHEAKAQSREPAPQPALAGPQEWMEP